MDRLELAEVSASELAPGLARAVLPPLSPSQERKEEEEEERRDRQALVSGR